MEPKRKLEKALRDLLSVELEETSPSYQRRQIDRAIDLFFEGKLKIWYFHGYLTFTESTEGAFEK